MLQKIVKKSLPFSSESSINLADWLDDNDFSTDEKVVILPNYIPSFGEAIFKKMNWKPKNEGGEYPSPYLTILESFLDDLTAELSKSRVISTNDYNIINGLILNKMPNKLASNSKYHLSKILLDLEEGNIFINFDERIIDRWQISIKNLILDKLNPSPPKGELNTIQEKFEKLQRLIGSSYEGKYYRQAKLVAEEIIMVLLEEGIFNDDPSFNEIENYLGVNLLNFYFNLKGRDSPHKPKTIMSIIEAFENALTHDSRYNQDDINRIKDKIQAIINPYIEISGRYWHAEEEIFRNIKIGPRKKLISNILHSHEVLEQIDLQSYLSKLLFASRDYLNSHFLVEGEIDLRPEISRLERMRFLVTRWDSPLFESLGLEATEYQIEVAKKNVLEEIQKWIFMNPRAKFFVTNWQIYDFERLEVPIKLSKYDLQRLKSSVIKSINNWIKSNPYKGDVRITKGEHYIAEQFTKYGQTYSQEDLYPDFELSNDLYFAVMQRKFIEYKKEKPLSSITEVSPLEFSISLEDVQKELGVKKDFYKDLFSGASGRRPSFYSKKSLEKILQKLAKWHKEEFGSRDIGLTYFGRRADRITYDKNDQDIQALLYYYQAAINSIYSYASLRKIDLTSFSKTEISLKESLKNKGELVMNHYDVQYWDKESTKAYHNIYHLCRYLGFDPITFTSLNDNIFPGGEKRGGYKRHHFLALMFRKMSSHVDDIVLTSDDFHISEYEGFLRKKGIEAEVYIKQLMKSLVELIEMKDHNGDFLKIKEEHMQEVLYKNFGEIEGEKVLEKWKSQDDFILSVRIFNDRRLDAFKGDYKNFLKNQYNNAYSAYYNKVRDITFTRILATHSNLDFLSTIYRIPFRLNPIQTRIN